MSRSCGHCGAAIDRLDARFCEYCGHELPPSEGAAPRAPTPHEERMRRLSAVRERADWDTLQSHVPATPGLAAGVGCQSVVLLVFVGFGLFWTVTASGMGAGAFSWFGLIFVAVGLLMLVAQFRRLARFRKAPLRREPAVIADERIKVSGGGRSSNSGASTRYFVSLEFEDGDRQEFQTTEAVASSVSREDVGVAFLRDRYLLEFRRLRA